MPAPLPVVVTTEAVCCPPLGQPAGFSEDEAMQLALKLRAIGEPNRLRILQAISQSPQNQSSTRELAPALGLTEATVSHHLRQLAEAGFLTKARDGARVNYRFKKDALRALASFLAIECACSSTCCC